MTSISQNLRNKIYGRLYEVMLDAVEAGKMDYFTAQDSAGYILEQVDSITTPDQLLEFLQKLSTRWEIYKEAQKELTQIDVQDKATQIREEDQQKISALQSKLNKYIS